MRVTAANDQALVGTQLPAANIDGSVIARVFHTGDSMFLPDPRGHPMVSPALLALTDARSVYLTPVFAGEVITAVLLVAWKHRVPDLDDRRVAVVTLLTDHAGVALRQAALVTELMSLARTDSLTGLPNRRNWNERLDMLMAMAARSGKPLTVALADLDRFKEFNDARGHHAGDTLLRAFALAGITAVRAEDTVARWGGEEFALALPDCPPGEAAAVLERVRCAMPEQQTCSIGYAMWNGTESATELMHRADRALYGAKSAGRNRVRLSD